MTCMGDYIEAWRKTDSYLGWWVRTGCERVIAEAYKRRTPLTLEEEEWLTKALPICFALRYASATELKGELLALKETAPRSAHGRAAFPGETLFEAVDGGLTDLIEGMRAEKAKGKRKL